MRVKDLIECLEDFDPEAEILLAYPAGDYWRTTVASEPGEPHLAYVKHSEYHRLDRVIDSDDSDPEYDPETRRVVVMRARKWG